MATTTTSAPVATTVGDLRCEDQVVWQGTIRTLAGYGTDGIRPADLPDSDARAITTRTLIFDEPDGSTIEFWQIPETVKVWVLAPRPVAEPDWDAIEAGAPWPATAKTATAELRDQLLRLAHQLEADADLTLDQARNLREAASNLAGAA